MIQVYPKHTRYSTDLGWLKSNLSFSFGTYFDENNTAFGPLRVCNDDTVAPRRGFGAHPHSDMEIVSVVLKGKLRHEDNLGNVAITGFGEVQRMTAGTGVVHTEANPSEEEEVNLLQIWFMPERKGLPPSYETSNFDVTRLDNRLLPIVSREGGDGIASIHQDLTIYLSRLDRQQQINFEQQAGRRMFIYNLEGRLQLNNGAVLEERATARITDVTKLELSASTNSFFMLIDLP